MERGSAVTFVFAIPIRINVQINIGIEGFSVDGPQKSGELSSLVINKTRVVTC